VHLLPTNSCQTWQHLSNYGACRAALIADQAEARQCKDKALDAKALALMGRKMRAAQTMWGDEIGSAIVMLKKADLFPS